MCTNERFSQNGNALPAKAVHVHELVFVFVHDDILVHVVVHAQLDVDAFLFIAHENKYALVGNLAWIDYNGSIC
jgi:hypothetical protein